jgi:large subunit ribosomal protein L29
MKAKQLRDLSGEELLQKLSEAEKELFGLRVKKSSGQLEKPDRIRILRREIARIRTLLNEAKGA